MAEHASEPTGSTSTPRATRDAVEQLLLAGIGAVALTAERIEELVDALVKRGGVQRDEARAAVEDTVSRWRGDATRATEKAGNSFQTLLRELGLVLRSEHEELELRVAQLGHRVRLMEASDDATIPPTAPTV
jgi:polyhydroxyalkanoate synthesis regulator phasin